MTEDDPPGLDFTPEGIRIMCSKPLPEESKIQMKMLIPERKAETDTALEEV
ncbi:MAG: hypothetical protein NTW09_05890 [Candidatus Omnitrophica bacterium]|nr:hypothetical protein [Candidatus Omnitrophota bacterium]